MEYALQFKKFVKKTIKKNMAFLPDLTEFEIESECWASVASALVSWDGTKGNIKAWVCRAVVVRVMHLRKPSHVGIEFLTDSLETLIPAIESEIDLETPMSPMN